MKISRGNMTTHLFGDCSKLQVQLNSRSASGTDIRLLEQLSNGNTIISAI